MFEDGRFTLTEGEEQSANHLRLTLQGDGLAGEWTSKDGASATSHPVAATESYDGMVAFDVLSVEQTRALDGSLPDGPGAGFSPHWLIPRQTAVGERLDAVRQFAMNCVQRPETATADKGASAARGEPPCETGPVQATPEELARTAAED